MAKEKPGVTTLETAKRWLRRHLAGVRQSITPTERRRWSARITRVLTHSREYRRARTIALFIGFGSEVRTESIVRHAWRTGKNVLIPITSLGFDRPFFALFRKGDRLVRTSRGPFELVKHRKPFDMRKVDVVVVPGLGFDDTGHRLGYGGGVYDRLLERTPRARHIGLFFACQRIHVIPSAGHDRPMTAIVTENGFSPSEPPRSGLA